ncbi:MAG: hypothetical protein ABJD11_18175, partial [Gemmatimonadota bacterium]
MLHFPLLITSLLVGPAPADGAALIKAMHDQYAGKWYHNATFVQTTTFPEKHTTETWYEAMTIPNKLRIDIGPADSANAIIFRNDSVYRFQGGTLKAGRPFVHPLMVLGFDVYGIPPEATIAKLQALGFDLSKMHEENWQGRPTYVVGALAGDTTSKQFWIDKERLLFVRMLETNPQDASAIAETQFNKYQQQGGGWMAVEVTFRVAGKLLQKEEYAQVRENVALADNLWDVDQWRAAGWM